MYMLRSSVKWPEKRPASTGKRNTPTTELALKLIEENKRTRSPFLDLGNCGLTQIPPELEGLPWLETLVLAPRWEEKGERTFGVLRQKSSRNTGAKNRFGGKQPPLPRLSLRKLYLDHTWLADLTPISGLRELEKLSLSYNPVKDLSPLVQLTRVRELHVFTTPVADLSALANLTDLRVLSAGRTSVADLSPLTDLNKMEVLTIWETQVKDLSPLRRLTNLQQLRLQGSGVADLAPLANLTRLRLLNVSHTKVTDLSPLLHVIRSGCPVRWAHLSEPGIYVKECPLTNPPAEIAQQGDAAILNYFEEREGGVDHLYEAKMLILGKGGAGKTSLLRRLYYPDLPLPEPQETTKGIDIHRRDFPLPNGKQFRLNVWDFGGQEIYHATHQFFLTKRSIYALVDDTKEDNKSVSDEGFKYWLDLVEVFGGVSPVLIFQNEKAGAASPSTFRGFRHAILT